MNSIFSSQNMYIFFYNHLKNLSNIVLAPRGEISKNALKIKKFKKQIVLSIFKIFKISSVISFSIFVIITYFLSIIVEIEFFFE